MFVLLVVRPKWVGSKLKKISRNLYRLYCYLFRLISISFPFGQIRANLAKSRWIGANGVQSWSFEDNQGYWGAIGANYCQSGNISARAFRLIMPNPLCPPCYDVQLFTMSIYQYCRPCPTSPPSPPCPPCPSYPPSSKLVIKNVLVFVLDSK